MFCKHCGKQIDDLSAICPYCGKVTESETGESVSEYIASPTKKSSAKMITLLIAVVLIILSGVSGFFIGKKVSDDKNESIRQSEKEREKDEDDEDGDGFFGFGKKEEAVEITTVPVTVEEPDWYVVEDEYEYEDPFADYETQTEIITEVVEVTGVYGEVVTDASGEVVTELSMY